MYYNKNEKCVLNTILLYDHQLRHKGLRVT